MGGFGAMDHMNKSFKNNRELLKKISFFKDAKHYNKWDFKRSNKRKPTYKKASPEVIQAIRKKNRIRKIKNTIISIVAFLISVASVSYLTYYLFY